MSKTAMNDTFFVAVDGGGTGTRVRAYSPNRQWLGEGHAGASSLTLGVESAWKNIRSAIESATQNTPFAGQLPSRIVAGLAGSRNPQQRQAFLRHIDAQKILDTQSITIVSDAYTSALGALSRRSGIVVAIGTGLGACAIDTEGRPHYVSGWGFKVGDEGAGSWIGLQAVQAYLKHFDGREKRDSGIYEVLSPALGITVSDIQQWSLHATASDFARFAKPMVALAEQHDALAIEIMTKAADEVVQVIDAFDMIATNAPVVLLGGLGQVMQKYLPASVQVRLQSANGTSLDGASMVLFGDCPSELETLG